MPGMKQTAEGGSSLRAFEQSGDCTRRIADDTVASVCAETTGASDDLTSELLAAGDARIEIGYGDVDEPLGGQILVDASGVTDAGGRGVCLRQGHGVVVVAAHLHWHGAPTCDLFIESADSLRIAHGEIDP
jgi:hypothetical protein